MTTAQRCGMTTLEPMLRLAKCRCPADMQVEGWMIDRVQIVAVQVMQHLHTK